MMLEKYEKELEKKELKGEVIRLLVQAKDLQIPSSFFLWGNATQD